MPDTFSMKWGCLALTLAKWFVWNLRPAGLNIFCGCFVLLCGYVFWHLTPPIFPCTLSRPGTCVSRASSATCARSLYEDLLCKMFVSRSPPQGSSTATCARSRCEDLLCQKFVSRPVAQETPILHQCLCRILPRKLYTKILIQKFRTRSPTGPDARILRQRSCARDPQIEIRES